MVRYACDFCGYHGADPMARIVEEVQCPICGEPVMPLPEEATEEW
jgi:rubrerythrin